MTDRYALILLSLVCPCLLLLTVIPGWASVWLVAPLTCAIPVLLIIASAGRRQPGSVGLLALWVLLTGSWWILGWVTATTDLSRASASQALLIVAVMLLGLGLAPLVLLGWLFAMLQDADGHGVAPWQGRQGKGSQ